MVSYLSKCYAAEFALLAPNNYCYSPPPFRDKLKDHLRHHDRAARTFECSQCLSPFVQKSDLNRHIRGVHQGEPGVGINMTVRRKAPGKPKPPPPSLQILALFYNRPPPSRCLSY